MDKNCCTCLYEANEGYEDPCTDCFNEGKWKPKLEHDPVNHPSHYTHGKFECIDVMVDNFGVDAAKNFCLLNAFKYVWRCGKKNGAEDVRKAIWYMEKYLSLDSEE